MDQLACAVGGILAIDFAPTAGKTGTCGPAGHRQSDRGAASSRESQADWPHIERVSFRFEEHDARLLVIDTGGSHADLTDDYASVPAEMKQAASFFGAGTLGELDRDRIESNIDALRRACGDRPVLRALHFFDDTERVEEQFHALQDGTLDRFVALMRESGRSSQTMLQNCYSLKAPEEQGIPLAVALTDRFLKEAGASDGACRVHGGGFAGTVQSLIPLSCADAYVARMEEVFGAGSVKPVRIRSTGALRLARL
jgi:galactokinase